MKYTVYVIKSLHKDYVYVWMTNNIERRLYEHNSKQSKSTRHYAPFVVLYQEEMENGDVARLKEKYFKSGQWRKRIRENLI
jgi:putative endonuclease